MRMPPFKVRLIAVTTMGSRRLMSTAALHEDQMKALAASCMHPGQVSLIGWDVSLSCCTLTRDKAGPGDVQHSRAGKRLQLIHGCELRKLVNALATTDKHPAEWSLRYQVVASSC